MNADSIIVNGLSKSFGKKEVLSDITLSLPAGSIFGLVGLNGAGKTTLIRLLLGLLRPDKGTISIQGFDPWRHSAAFYRRLGVILEHDGFSGNLTFCDNIRFFAHAKGVAPTQADEYLAQWWKDAEIVASPKKVKFFSRGQKMQAAVCRAFLGWPAVCFFDEPAVGLDIGAYDQFCRLVKEACSRGSAMIISSHQLETIEELCDTIGILHNRTLRIFSAQEASPAAETWLIATDNDPVWGDVVRQNGGERVLWKEGAWRFQVTDVARTIPRIIRALVIAGCDIREVKAEKDDLRGSIRKMYQGL
jgi:ABC-type multidrug transport system ATPase subunit